MSGIGWRWPPLLCGIGAAALLAFLLVLEAAVGPLGGASMPRDADAVALVDSALTASYFASTPGASRDGYRQRVQTWQAFLERAGMTVRVIGDADLDHGVVSERVVVLPSVAVLSRRAAGRLARMVHTGGSVVATWQLGMRRPGGAWHGYGVLRRLFGVRSLAPASDPPALRFLAVRGGRPLAAGLPAGMRMEVQPYDAPLLVSAADADAEWTRWELLPFADADGERALRPAAVVRARRGRGRAVWLDFEPGAVTAAGAADVEGLVRNVLAWAAGRPIVAVDTWPPGARLAALFGLDTEDHFANAALAVDALQAAHSPATFFCVSRLAEADPATFARLVAAGEIGSHTDDHRILGGQDAALQETRLRDSASTLQRLGAAAVVGIRPPEEQTDAQTGAAAARAGYRYVAGARDKDRAEPVVSPDGVVVLPRIPRDDFDWLVKQGVNDPDRLVAAVRADLGAVRRLGGLYYFSFHTQSLESPALRAALAALLDDTAAPDVWRTRADAIADWWRKRTGVSVRAERRGPAGVRVTLTAREPLDAVGVRVFLATAPRDVEVKGSLGPRPRARRRLRARDPGVLLSLERLRAGETRVVDVDVVP